MTDVQAQTQAQPAPRKVGFLLGVGIFFMPYVFGWLTLRKGHSSTAKIVSFAWRGVFVLAYAASDKAPSSSSAMTAADLRDRPAVAPAQAPPSKKAIGLNEEFRLGKFTYTVNKVEKTKSISGSFSRERASPGALFLVVRYTERNDGNETHRGLGAPFKLVDGKGRTFDTSSKANTALMMAGGDVDLIAELQPGISKEGVTAFEVPEDAVSSPFKLVVSERGWGGGNFEIAVAP